MNINTVRRAMRSGCGHGGAIRSAGEVRASAPIRALVAVIAALLAVALFPSYAMADSSGVIWGPSLLPSQDIGVVVNAPDRYRAAAAALGHSDAEISSWSDEVLAKLSNESTGGAFYTFAQKFGEVDDAVGSDNPITAVISAVGDSFWAVAETLYGNDIWIAGYSAQEFESAANDLASILSGENIGGGGGSGGPANASFPVTLECTRGKYTQDNAGVISGEFHVRGSNIKVLAVDAITVQYDLASNVTNSIPSDYEVWAVVYTYGSSTTFGMVNIVALPAGLGELREVNGHTGIYAKEPCVIYKGDSALDSNDSSLSYSGQNISLSKSWIYISRNNVSANEAILTENDNSRGFYFSGAVSQPVVPPSNWPDEPSAPSPPELPEPGTNPTVTPAPWSPVLSPTFDFDLNITTDPTSSDLIDWVQKIYYELKAFHRDAHDWANDFGGGFTKVVQAVNSASSQLYSQLLVIDSSIHDEGLKIRNYMYQMFHWLRDQLNFQNDSFNDNNIVYWLKRIWSKLGSGDINLRPTDPTTEPDDWWDWLVKAIQNFLIGLAATSTELISEIADIASQVMHEFPFSIPWDIAAILAALTTAPITPKFTFVIPAVQGWWNDVQFVVDLAPFDTAAETIRLMEKLLFTGFLIWKSKDLLDFMDVTKWFN